jgi:hypothetical protein
MTKIVLLNGPIGCGKTELSNVLVEGFGFSAKRCKDKLHELTMSFFCVDSEEYWRIYEDRVFKESPSPIFTLKWEAYEKLCKALGGGSLDSINLKGAVVELSLRLAMIYVSEVLCKPTFGSDYFGVARAADLHRELQVVDDSVGFVEELIPTIDMLGQENCLLVRVHGRGTFEGDSRRYIPDGVVNNTIDIDNTGTLEEFLSESVGNILKWCNNG